MQLFKLELSSSSDKAVLMTIAGKNLILYLIWKTALTVAYYGTVVLCQVSARREIPSMNNPMVLKNPAFTVFPLNLSIW